MSRRPKTSPPPASLYEDAYHWQVGQFYPERHLANVQRLHDKYPDLPLGEIDAIYREACRIDYEVRERVGTSTLSNAAKQELLDWLEDHFCGFSRDSLLWAIERAESH